MSSWTVKTPQPSWSSKAPVAARPPTRLAFGELPAARLLLGQRSLHPGGRLRHARLRQRGRDSGVEACLEAW
jgi:hypothetical protein